MNGMGNYPLTLKNKIKKTPKLSAQWDTTAHLAEWQEQQQQQMSKAGEDLVKNLTHYWCEGN
jgi:hypothetical protein